MTGPGRKKKIGIIEKRVERQLLVFGAMIAMVLAAIIVAIATSFKK